MSNVVPANKQFREKVARAVAMRIAPPGITHTAWGTDGTPQSDEDTSLGNEIHRQQVVEATADGTVLTVTDTLHGSDVPEKPIREVAIIDSDGDLAGRRTLGPVELADGTNIDITLTLQF